MRYGMVIDLNRCVGCFGCQLACKAENGTPPGTLWARVVRREVGTFPNVYRYSIPLLCMQCESPPCVEVCPTGASEKRANGVVTIDADSCVGCRYCMMACPYNSRYYNAEEQSYFLDAGPNAYEAAAYARHPVGVVQKCDFCSHRVEQGLEPACVANCMTKARIFGDLDDPQSAVARLARQQGAFRLHPDVGTGPSVYYLPPRNVRS